MKVLKYFIVIAILFISCKEGKKEQITPSEAKIIAKVLDSINLSNGTIQRVKNFPSKYVRPRNVDIWLPENYSESKKYAVLYMHDGQMLFDAEITWNKQEWKVDEIVGGLLEEQKIKDCIVVAMWNHSDIRHNEYYPKNPFQKLDTVFVDSIKNDFQDFFKTEIQSDNYLKFIVEEVKPFIDSNYAVYTTSENIFIAGSSMGGLISMYALCEYPTVFGGAGCLSTHWSGMMPMENNPIPESFFSYLALNLPSSKNHKIYFDYGTKTLDEFYLPYQHRVDEVLKLKGYDSLNSKNLKFEGHDHSENSWNQRFQIPVEFLLKKD